MRNLKNFEMRDIFFKILRLGQNFTIMNLLSDLEEFNQMVSASTPTITELFNQ